MANINIRKTADSTNGGVRTFSWEIYDKSKPSTVLSSGSASHTATMVTDSVLKNIFSNLLEEYFSVNNIVVVDDDIGVSQSTQLITLTSTYTLTSQTGIQKMFNVPSLGTLTVEANTTYYFECEFSLSSLSVSSGSVSFGFLGTATFTRIKYWALANKAAVTPGATLLTLGTAKTAVTITSATTTTTGSATIRGKIVVGTGGTIIPAVGMSVAAAAVVGIDSSFKIWKVGSNTVQSVGSWT